MSTGSEYRFNRWLNKEIIVTRQLIKQILSTLVCNQDELTTQLKRISGNLEAVWLKQTNPIPYSSELLFELQQCKAC